MKLSQVFLKLFYSDQSKTEEPSKIKFMTNGLSSVEDLRENYEFDSKINIQQDQDSIIKRSE